MPTYRYDEELGMYIIVETESEEEAPACPNPHDKVRLPINHFSTKNWLSSTLVIFHCLYAIFYQDLGVKSDYGLLRRIAAPTILSVISSHKKMPQISSQDFQHFLGLGCYKQFSSS